MTAAAAVAVIGLASAFLVAFVVWPAQRLVDTRFDPYGYGAIAEQMLRDGFAAHGLTKREASLYPVAIAAVYRIAGPSPVLIIIGQCVMFAVTCLLTFDIGRRVFNRRTGTVAGLLVALNPLLLRYVADFHMETMLTCVITLNVWTMVRFFRRRTVGNGVLVGATAAVAALTKGVALVAPCVFGLYWIAAGLLAWRRGGRPPAGWSAVAAIAIATVLVIAPWTMRNYRVTGGRFVPLAPGLSDAFLRGYIFSRFDYALLRRPPYVDAENECNLWLRSICARAGAEFGRDEVRDEQILAAAARQMILEAPVATIRKVVVGLFTFWYQMTSPVTSAVAAAFTIAAWLLAWLGWTRAAEERRPTWLLLLPIVSMNLVIALLCALGRYSMPILPCLMILAAFGVDTVVVHRAKGERGTMAEA